MKLNLPYQDFEPHPWRAPVLAELHARPFHPLRVPCSIVHFAFMTDALQAIADRNSLITFCELNGIQPPEESAKHHRASLQGGSLRWEQHSEFTTYTWELGPNTSESLQSISWPHRWMRDLGQPGPHLLSVSLTVQDSPSDETIEHVFGTSPLAGSLVENGSAAVATDFVARDDGFVRIVVLNRGLAPGRVGALVQRLLEIETYRTLALLGLPEAHRLTHRVQSIEDALSRVARSMVGTKELSNDRTLLQELTELAATLEADSASAGFRFRASRAYDEIVQQRLVVIGEMPWNGLPTIGAFLSRRMAPAMRTCQMLEDRRSELSRKLTRATNLLRTRVDVEIEQQNRNLLHSMNERTRLQLRLQQTVEVFSVAAISYYVVGLLGHLFDGLKEVGAIAMDPKFATALAVPISVIVVGALVLSLHRSYTRQAVVSD